ncbi:HlyD family efflux transporter periplasmic adaptor subunit [Salipiger sp. IMCC34102]|uniref:HlyD family efflux transporter periplasmic adaptor subunit n=1 Tax=Salipiger sp. IMCC34102 TaxID=2510647 RepID=UPI0013EB4DEA|nr:HlyD family secretion protein [Salipiger sp. IMCC34102]
MRASVLRIPAAIVLLGAAGTAIAPRLTNHVSSAAVVNAPLVSVYSPFDGTIVTASEWASSVLEPGDTIAVVRDLRSESAHLRALRSEVARTSGEISGISSQRRRLEAVEEDLRARRTGWIAARIDWFDHRLDEADANIAAARAAVTQAEDVADRLNRLQGTGNVTQRDVSAAEADLAAARAGLDREIAVRRRLQVERDFLEAEDTVDLGSSTLDQINSRLDEIALRDADLYTRLLTLQTSRAALQTEISGLEVEKARNDTFAPKSSHGGIIWETSGQVGTNVGEGEQIAQVLDCSRRFLEVMIGASYIESITPGDSVSVQLKGDKARSEGTVFAVYGSGARPNRQMEAARPRIETPDGLRVIVGIGPVDLTDPDVGRSFCDVGRAAEVHFTMKSISALSNAFASLRKLAGFAPVMTAELEASNTDTAVN